MTWRSSQTPASTLPGQVFPIIDTNESLLVSVFVRENQFSVYELRWLIVVVPQGVCPWTQPWSLDRWLAVRSRTSPRLGWVRSRANQPTLNRHKTLTQMYVYAIREVRDVLFFWLASRLASSSNREQEFEIFLLLLSWWAWYWICGQTHAANPELFCRQVEWTVWLKSFV